MVKPSFCFYKINLVNFIYRAKNRHPRIKTMGSPKNLSFLCESSSFFSFCRFKTKFDKCLHQEPFSFSLSETSNDAVTLSTQTTMLGIWLTVLCSSFCLAFYLCFYTDELELFFSGLTDFDFFSPAEKFPN